MKYSSKIEDELKSLGLIPGAHVAHNKTHGTTFVIADEWYEINSATEDVIILVQRYKSTDNIVRSYVENLTVIPTSNINNENALRVNGFFPGAYIKCAGDDYVITDKFYIWEGKTLKLICIKNGDRYGIHYLNVINCAPIKNISQNFDKYEIF